MNKQSLSFHNKMVWFTTASILFLLFIVPGLLASLIKMTPANDQPGYSGDNRVSIYGKRDFSQTFISKYDNLVAVATTIRNPNLKNKKDIIFNLFDEDNNLIRATKLNGFNLNDGDFVKIVFEPILASKDKKYYFTIASPDAGNEETIELFLTGQTTEVIEYEYDDEVRPGGAPMVTFHKPVSRLETVKLVYLNFFEKW